MGSPTVRVNVFQNYVGIATLVLLVFIKIVLLILQYYLFCIFPFRRNYLLMLCLLGASQDVCDLVQIDL